MKIAVTAALLLLTISSYPQTRESFTIHFDFDKYALTRVTRSQLDSFLLVEKPNLSKLDIQLHGHCDAMGSDGYNNRLSEQRVAEVKKYLLNNGVEELNIVEESGHGKRMPLNENKTARERQLNRRVTISFVRDVKTDLPGTTLIKKIADTTTTAGTNIVLRNINFVGGRHVFLPESIPMLTELREAMRTYPNLVIRVEGHICCIPGDSDGPDLGTGLNNLSEARAKAVMDYLVANGIEANRVSYKGFGHSMPLYPFPEKTEEEQTLNRRVEIKIISK